ncbi:MAG TPA: DUF131 domain-containing protein [Thermoplasmata archaeon]|nr:DUF131 domain-containing protein [Thermoplasmata archaeon]
MRILTVAGLACLVLGLALIGLSLASGEGHLFLVLFVPVFTSGGLLGLAGMLALIAGIFLGVASFAGPRMPVGAEPPAQSPAQAPAPPAAAPAPRYGGVVMVGPIPLVFGSDARVAKWMMVLGIVLMGLVVGAFVFLSLR